MKLHDIYVAVGQASKVKYKEVSEFIKKNNSH